ncbi:unnamed protein product [Scytosiphon promiscuus]
MSYTRCTYRAQRFRAVPSTVVQRRLPPPVLCGMSFSGDDDSGTSSDSSDDGAPMLFAAIMFAISYVLICYMWFLNEGEPVWDVFRDAYRGRSTRCRQLAYAADLAFTAFSYGVAMPMALLVVCVGYPLFTIICIPRALVRCLRPERVPQEPPSPAINTGWENRGWLVMLRARHLSSLVRTPGAPRRTFFGVVRREKKQRKPFKLNDTMGAHAVVGGEQEVERGRVSSCDWEFARIIANITEVNEEGVFRYVVSYV